MRFASLAAIAILLLPLITQAQPAASPPKPNILIILADDMGFSDAGCYGGEIATPNIDRLAANGLRFTQFHNTARCWPSRASLLTGFYAQQVRRDTLPGVVSGTRGVRPAWARLLPEMLKPLGYRSYHSGKWHIDGPRLKAGFDRSYSLEDHDRYFAPRLQFEDDRKLPAIEPGTDFYTTTAIADHAIKYLQEHARDHAQQPFFQYLAFTSPHFPLQAPAADIARQQGKYDAGWDVMRKQRWQRQRDLGLLNVELPTRDAKTIPPWNIAEAELQKRIGPGEVGYAVAWDNLTPEQRKFQAAKMEVHAAMVDRMDQEIGRVLAQVHAMGATSNTIVLFMSDNGATAEQIIRGDGHDLTAPQGSAKTFLGIGPGWSTACNTPLRLHKSWVHEGGISTPLIIRWPKGIQARGELRKNPSHLIDIVPTLLALAGGPTYDGWQGAAAHPPAPGKSLVPVFTKDNSVAHDYFWWFHEGNRAIRVGDWKLVSAGKNGSWELYDLSTDRSEMHDMASSQPEKVKELSKAWQDHFEEFRATALKDMPAEVKVKKGGANEE
jgi:arylsulfatase A-like enzyme